MISSEYIIVSRRVVTPEGLREAGVHVRSGVIVDVVDVGKIPAGIPAEDVGDLVLMPGLVDTHVHINEPGRKEWEGFVTATKAAAAGGVTTLVDMPLNSSPVTTTVEAFRQKITASSGKLFVDCGFYAGLIPGNTSELRQLVNAGVLGVKAFLADSGLDEFPKASEQDLRSAMGFIAESGLPLLVHAELAIDVKNPWPEASDGRSYQAYLASRPRKWEHDAIELMISLCREFNCRTHIVHLSSANELTGLEKARRSGLPLTVETCPHYLYFSAEEIKEGDTRSKCAPPIRERENRERLWDGLKRGVIDFIVSDHSPCPPEMKLLSEGNFRKAWGGIASLQFGLSIVWTAARGRGFSVADIAEWMSRRPAQLAGLQGRKGAIAPGYDADLVAWDPDGSFVVRAADIHHRHTITPYEGRELRGTIIATYLRGTKVFAKGKFSGDARGKVIVRENRTATHATHEPGPKEMEYGHR